MSTRTLTQLLAEVRQRADSTSDDSFITDAELTRYINQSAKELYDLLIQNQGQEYYLSRSTTNFVNGTDTYSLPATFYKLLGVDINGSNGDVDSAKPYMLDERNAYLNYPWPYLSGEPVFYRISGANIEFIPMPGTSATSYTLLYIPAFVDLVFPDVGNTPFDGFNGWEEYVVVDAAMKMLEKEESDTSALAMRKALLVRRIESLSANRDAGAPERVKDTGWYY